MKLSRKPQQPMVSTLDGVISSDADRPSVSATFTFDPAFPVAFTVQFDTLGDSVTWVIGRELVSEALVNSCAGLADVGLSTRAGDMFVFDLRYDHHYAQVTLARSLVEAFFVASERMVPPTQEYAWLEAWSASVLQRLVGAA